MTETTKYLHLLACDTQEAERSPHVSAHTINPILYLSQSVIHVVGSFVDIVDDLQVLTILSLVRQRVPGHRLHPVLHAVRLLTQVPGEEIGHLLLRNVSAHVERRLQRRLGVAITTSKKQILSCKAMHEDRCIIVHKTMTKKPTGMRGSPTRPRGSSRQSSQR